jgi:hypothetical protein
VRQQRRDVVEGRVHHENAAAAVAQLLGRDGYRDRRRVVEAQARSMRARLAGDLEEGLGELLLDGLLARRLALQVPPRQVAQQLLLQGRLTLA